MNGFSFADIQAFANMVYAGRPFILTPFAYPVVFTSLAQNASSTASLSITANADFILTRIRYRAWISSAGLTYNTTVIPNVQILVTDTGSNEQFTNTSVDLANWGYNNSQAVGALPYPRYIAGRTALSVAVTNNSPASETYGRLEILFEGCLARQYSDGRAN